MENVNNIVERAFTQRGVKFSGPDEAGNYSLELEGGPIIVNTENIARNYARDNDPTAVDRFVETVIATSVPAEWHSVKAFVRFSLEPSDHNFTDTVHRAVTEEVTQVLVFTDADESKIVWITTAMLEEWGMQIDEAIATASQNMAELLNDLEPELTDIEGQKLAMVPLLSEAFKASTILAPNFKEFITKGLTWPVLAVIPCRDFIYVLSQADQSLLNRMGHVVQREYRDSGYPITTEVLMISDEGIEAIGAFPK